MCPLQALTKPAEPAIAPTPRRGLPHRALGDDRLGSLIATGCDQAFETLYSRYGAQLSRYARSLVGSESDAQDAMQSAMTNALLALRAGRRDAPMRPWLYRIVHNESISLIRRRHPGSESAFDELVEASSPTARSSSEVAEERARLQQLVRDLQELGERQRAALVLREMSGLSHEEIASALGISVGVAKQTVLEARRSLSEFGAGRAMDCEEIEQLISDGDGRALRGRRVRGHLSDCTRCNAFAEAIGMRARDLNALLPALPAAALTVPLLTALSQGGSVTAAAGAGAAASGGAVISGAGAVGLSTKTGVLALLTVKAIASTVAAVAVVAGGVSAVTFAEHPHHQATPTSRNASRHAPRPSAASARHAPSSSVSLPTSAPGLNGTQPAAPTAAKHVPPGHIKHGANTTTSGKRIPSANTAKSVHGGKTRTSRQFAAAVKHSQTTGRPTSGSQSTAKHIRTGATTSAEAPKRLKPTKAINTSAPGATSSKLAHVKLSHAARTHGGKTRAGASHHPQAHVSVVVTTPPGKTSGAAKKAG
jgi:RNA polymerase sigma factor (sigma-70 family)